ncbi:MAG TPA: 16S rRNA (uracil(1498)-N(3))-methyltransferase [Chthoniobacterales bacterium]
MHRFHIPPTDWNPDALVLSPGESHHAIDVLRLGTGSRVVVFDGRGTEVTAEIIDTTKSGVRLKAQQTAKTPKLRCAITLGQAIPKGKNMDLIIQKATELGAAAIAPLLSERTVVSVDAGDAEKKRAKWQEAVVEAAKQCGQNWIPEVSIPQTPKAFFEQGNRYDLMLIASLQPDARHLKKVLAEVEAETGGLPSSVLILVGPEGDFTPAEMALAKSHGCRPITLGPIVLRTETASLYCLSVLGYELLQ